MAQHKLALSQKTEPLLRQSLVEGNRQGVEVPPQSFLSSDLDGL